MTTIRKADTADIEAVHKLIHELAIYEKAPEKHVVTADALATYFTEKRFDLLVAENKGAIVGMLLHYEGYSTWKGPFMYVEDFVVTNDYRRKGIGRLLFNAAITEAKQKGLAFVKWQVLDWNTPAISFYEQFGITKDDSWIDCKKYI